MENEYKADYGLLAKNGALMGALMGVVTILMYVISEPSLANGILGMVFLLVYVIIFGVLGVKYRNQMGTYMTYGQAYGAIFVMIFVASIVNTVFSILLYNVIDTELGGRLTEITVQTTEDMLRKFGAPEDQIQQSIQAARETDNYSLSNLLLGGVIFLGVIGNAIVTLVLAAIAKKKPEESY